MGVSKGIHCLRRPLEGLPNSLLARRLGTEPRCFSALHNINPSRTKEVAMAVVAILE
jgi:hypothetical protein